MRSLLNHILASLLICLAVGCMGSTAHGEVASVQGESLDEEEARARATQDAQARQAIEEFYWLHAPQDEAGGAAALTAGAPAEPGSEMIIEAPDQDGTDNDGQQRQRCDELEAAHDGAPAALAWRARLDTTDGVPLECDEVGDAE